MKKLLVTLTTIGMLVMSMAAVSAAEVTPNQGSFFNNKNAETFLENRLEQLKEALDSGLLSQEQYDLMVEHMTEVAEDGTFGMGPNGYLYNSDCLLGEDMHFQIFRNQNAGLRGGQGQGSIQRQTTGRGYGYGRQGFGGCH